MKELKLKQPLELEKMTKSEMYNYIDMLHMILKDYQIIIDTAISKNLNVK